MVKQANRNAQTKEEEKIIKEQRIIIIRTVPKSFQHYTMSTNIFNDLRETTFNIARYSSYTNSEKQENKKDCKHKIHQLFYSIANLN